MLRHPDGEINLATTSEALTEYKPVRRPAGSASGLMYMCMHMGFGLGLSAHVHVYAYGHMGLELGLSAQQKRIWPQLFGNVLVWPLGSAEAKDGIWPPQSDICGASMGGAWQQELKKG